MNWVILLGFKKGIEAKGLAQNVIFLPAKRQNSQPPENAKFEIELGRLDLSSRTQHDKLE